MWTPCVLVIMGGSESKETICINGSDNKAIESTKIDSSIHIPFIDCSNQHGGFIIGAFVLLLIALAVNLYVFKKKWGTNTQHFYMPTQRGTQPDGKL